MGEKEFGMSEGAEIGGVDGRARDAQFKGLMEKGRREIDVWLVAGLTQNNARRKAAGEFGAGLQPRPWLRPQVN